MTFNYNAPISEELTKYFKEYTTEIDVADVCKKTDVGFHTLRRLRLGETNVSNEENGKAITELMKTAIENAKNKKERIIKDERKMKKNLIQIFDCL